MKLFNELAIESMNFADEHEDQMDFHPDYGKVGTWHISFRAKDEDKAYESDVFAELKAWIDQEMTGPYTIIDSSEMGGDETLMCLSLFDFKDASLFYQKFEFSRQLHWVIHMLMQTFEWFRYEVPHADDALMVNEWTQKNVKLATVGVVGGKLCIVSINKNDAKKAEKAFSGSLVKDVFVRKTEKKNKKYAQGYRHFVSMKFYDQRRYILDRAYADLLVGSERNEIGDRVEYYFSSIEQIKEALAYGALVGVDDE